MKKLHWCYVISRGLRTTQIGDGVKPAKQQNISDTKNKLQEYAPGAKKNAEKNVEKGTAKRAKVKASELAKESTKTANASTKVSEAPSSPQNSTKAPKQRPLTYKGRMIHPKSGTAWAVPTKEDLKQLNLVLNAYWYRIWFMRYCAENKDLQQGAWFHTKFLSQGEVCHVLIGTQLLDMYAKCRDTEKAYEVFQRIENKNVVTWNFMIGAFVLRSKDEFPENYERMDYGYRAINLFHHMNLEGLRPNAITLTNMVNACGSVHNIRNGRMAHEVAKEYGYDIHDTILGNALIGMYYICKYMGRARDVFEALKTRTVVTWTQLILAYSRIGNQRKSLYYHHLMRQEGMEQDRASLVAGLDACSKYAVGRGLTYGTILHREIISMGLEPDVFAGTAVVHMYGSCSKVEQALRAFSRIEVKNAYTYNSIITSFAKAGLFQETIQFYECMQQEGVPPDKYSFVAVLQACAALLAFEYGQKAHRWIRHSHTPQNEFVKHALANFYGRCESFEVSRKIFTDTAYKTTENFTTMVSIFALHGLFNQATEYFHTMNGEGILPSVETFTALLEVCSHKGRLPEFRSFFHSMVTDFNLEHSPDHFKSALHILGRKGRTSKMYNLITRMPFNPRIEDWLCMLTACELQRNVKLAKIAAKQMSKLDVKDHMPFEILGNIHVEEGKMGEAEEMFSKMRAYKQREFSLVEVRGKMYKFLEGYKKQVFYEKLDEFVRRVKVRMRAAGYVFKATSLDLIKGKVEEEGHHSEVLAIAFGILKGPEEKVIRVVNKHRMCSDCHGMIKYVSMVFNRKVVVRDMCRFHSFEDGLCSCRDFW